MVSGLGTTAGSGLAAGRSVGSGGGLPGIVIGPVAGMPDWLAGAAGGTAAASACGLRRRRPRRGLASRTPAVAFDADGGGGSGVTGAPGLRSWPQTPQNVADF